MGSRLSVIDEMFLWTHRGLGLPVVMQGLWRTDGVVDADALEQLCDRIASGPLGRRVRRPRFPGARPEFIVDTSRYPLSFRTEPVPVEQVVDWADAQALVTLDPERGPGWRIAATLDSDGGTVVSVTCSHVLADARGLINALYDAMNRTSSALADSAPISDRADAVATTTRVLRGLTQAVFGLIVSPARRAELRGLRSSSAATRGPDRHRISSAIVEIDAALWDEVANTAGGTPNSLFLACVGHLARRENETGTVTLSVPMNVRTAKDPDTTITSIDNAVAMVAVPLTPLTTLGEIRSLCREAFESPPMSSPAGFPAELLQVVPDRLAHRLADGPGQRDALCSNIGRVDIGAFDGHPTSGLALRAVHPAATAAQLNCTSTRISGYLCRIGGTYTLSLVSFEAVDGSALREQALESLATFGITARVW